MVETSFTWQMRRHTAWNESEPNYPGRENCACIIPAKVRKESGIIYHVMVSGILFGRCRNKALCPVLGE